MIKKMIWVNERQLISGEDYCSMMKPTSEISQDCKMEDLSCLSPDGTLLVMCEQNHMVRVRRVVCNDDEWRPGDVLFPCQQLPAAQVLDFAWSPDSALVAVQLIDGSTYTYQTRSGWAIRLGRPRGIYRVGAPLHHERALVFAPRKKRIAQALPMGGVVLWEADTGTLFREIDTGLTLSIAWSPSERYLALGGNDATVTIHLASTGRFLRQMEGHKAGVSALAWSPDGTCLVSGDRHGSMQHWNTASGDPETWDCLGPLEPSKEAGIDAFAWSPDGHLAVLDSQDQLGIFDIFPSRQ